MNKRALLEWYVSPPFALADHFSDTRAVRFLRECLILPFLRHWCSMRSALGSHNPVLWTLAQYVFCVRDDLPER